VTFTTMQSDGLGRPTRDGRKRRPCAWRGRDARLQVREPAPLGRVHDGQERARALAAPLPVVAADDRDLGRTVADRFVPRKRDELARARRDALGDDPETRVVVHVANA
jgi:hypothetical protein